MDSEHVLLNAELGETTDPIRVDRIADLKLAAYRMFSQAKREIDIFSYDLDPRVLSDRQIEQAIASLARRSRNSRIRLLVFDSLALQSTDHRLIALTQSLSSYIQVKILANDFQQIPYSFYRVDDRGVIYRSLHSEYESQVQFNEPLRARELKKQFDDMWEQSRIASEFRALSL